jgi:hypothetical protein
MSFYNIMHGRNQIETFVLPFIPGFPGAPRFRDCFLAGDDYTLEDRKVLYYTRAGGNNRDDYEEEIDALQEHPQYETDYDDSFDNTYATFVFSVPEEWHGDYDALAAGNYVKFSDNYKDAIRLIFKQMGKDFDAWLEAQQ